jgi:hypothetical protein
MLQTDIAKGYFIETEMYRASAWPEGWRSDGRDVRKVELISAPRGPKPAPVADRFLLRRAPTLDSLCTVALALVPINGPASQSDDQLIFDDSP